MPPPEADTATEPFEIVAGKSILLLPLGRLRIAVEDFIPFLAMTSLSYHKLPDAFDAYSGEPDASRLDPRMGGSVPEQLPPTHAAGKDGTCLVVAELTPARARNPCSLGTVFRLG